MNKIRLTASSYFDQKSVYGALSEVLSNYLDNAFWWGNPVDDDDDEDVDSDHEVPVAPIAARILRHALSSRRALPKDFLKSILVLASSTALYNFLIAQEYSDLDIDEMDRAIFTRTALYKVLKLVEAHPKLRKDYEVSLKEKAKKEKDHTDKLQRLRLSEFQNAVDLMKKKLGVTVQLPEGQTPAAVLAAYYKKAD